MAATGASPMRDGANNTIRWLCQPLVGVALLFGVICHDGSPAVAEEFLGVEIKKINRTYVVTRDVNVRSKPEMSAKRVGGLKKGKRVHVAGQYQGWLAIMRDNKPLGFAFKKYLAPMIDGKLTQPVRGSASIHEDGKCVYEIIYSGRSTTDSEEFGMSDYEVQVQCDRDGAKLSFMLFMFMTESAYIPSKPNIHQIGIDLLEIYTDGEYDKSFTTNVFFNAEKGKAIFGDITIEPYAGKPQEDEVDAETMPEALNVAVRMALESWNDKAWDDLTAALKGE